MIEGKARAARNRHDLLMQAAWAGAALGRSKKMPPLASLLVGTAPKPKATSWQTMYAAAAGWVAVVGEIRTEPGSADRQERTDA